MNRGDGSVGWLPWGLLLDRSTMQLTGWRGGSIAESHGDMLRGCIGKVLTCVDGGQLMPVNTLERAMEAAEGCHALQLHFDTSCAVSGNMQSDTFNEQRQWGRCRCSWATPVWLSNAWCASLI